LAIGDRLFSSQNNIVYIPSLGFGLLVYDATKYGRRSTIVDEGIWTLVRLSTTVVFFRSP